MIAKKDERSDMPTTLAVNFLQSFVGSFFQTLIFFSGAAFFVSDALKNASLIGLLGVPFAVLAFALVIYRPKSVWHIIKSSVSWF